MLMINGCKLGTVRRYFHKMDGIQHLSKVGVMNDTRDIFVMGTGVLIGITVDPVPGCSDCLVGRWSYSE
jgi:hypothetical protein